MKKIALILAIIMIVSIAAVCLGDVVYGHTHMWNTYKDEITGSRENNKAAYVFGCSKVPSHYHWHGQRETYHIYYQECKCGAKRQVPKTVCGPQYCCAK